MEMNTCCFFGHRTINETEELKMKITETVERLIADENVDTFLFGSKSRFDSLCLELVTKIKEKYPHIKRIYVRAEFPIINDSYKAYLLENYEDTYYPEKIKGSGRAAYVERNYEMIDRSRFCIVYYDEPNSPPTAKAAPKSPSITLSRRKKISSAFPQKSMKVDLYHIKKSHFHLPGHLPPIDFLPRLCYNIFICRTERSNFYHEKKKRHFKILGQICIRFIYQALQ